MIEISRRIVLVVAVFFLSFFSFFFCGAGAVKLVIVTLLLTSFHCLLIGGIGEGKKKRQSRQSICLFLSVSLFLCVYVCVWVCLVQRRVICRETGTTTKSNKSMNRKHCLSSVSSRGCCYCCLLLFLLLLLLWNWLRDT